LNSLKEKLADSRQMKQNKCLHIKLTFGQRTVNIKLFCIFCKVYFVIFLYFGYSLSFLGLGVCSPCRRAFIGREKSFFSPLARAGLKKHTGFASIGGRFGEKEN